MLNIGNNNVRVFIGSTEVKSIYVGTDQVYPNGTLVDGVEYDAWVYVEDEDSGIRTRTARPWTGTQLPDGTIIDKEYGTPYEQTDAAAVTYEFQEWVYNVTFNNANRERPARIIWTYSGFSDPVIRQSNWQTDSEPISSSNTQFGIRVVTTGAWSYSGGTGTTATASRTDVALYTWNSDNVTQSANYPVSENSNGYQDLPTGTWNSYSYNYPTATRLGNYNRHFTFPTASQYTVSNHGTTFQQTATSGSIIYGDWNYSNVTTTTGTRTRTVTYNWVWPTTPTATQSSGTTDSDTPTSNNVNRTYSKTNNRYRDTVVWNYSNGDTYQVVGAYVAATITVQSAATAVLNIPASGGTWDLKNTQYYNPQIYVNGIASGVYLPTDQYTFTQGDCTNGDIDALMTFNTLTQTVTFASRRTVRGPELAGFGFVGVSVSVGVFEEAFIYSQSGSGNVMQINVAKNEILNISGRFAACIVRNISTNTAFTVRNNYDTEDRTNFARLPSHTNEIYAVNWVQSSGGGYGYSDNISGNITFDENTTFEFDSGVYPWDADANASFSSVNTPKYVRVSGPMSIGSPSGITYALYGNILNQPIGFNIERNSLTSYSFAYTIGVNVVPVTASLNGARCRGWIGWDDN